jgi:hypothetical protein
MDVVALRRRVFLRLVDKMSNLILEQQQFCVKLGNNESDTCAMLFETYEEYAMENSSVSELLKRFKESREIVEDDVRSGRPRSDRTDEDVGAFR